MVARLRAAGCVWAEDEAAVLRAAVPAAELAAAVDRRVDGEPLEHVVGWADFAGVRVRLSPPVFVPRPGAEPLVELACARVRGAQVVVDVGCGSGAIAAAVAAARPGLTVLATDTDPVAVDCARANGVVAYRGDWLDALPDQWLGGVDIAVAHLPYVPTGALGEVARDYRSAEPTIALDGGADGLAPLRQVLDQLTRWLAPGGSLLTLAADGQSAGVRTLAAAAGRSGQPLHSAAGSTFWQIG